MKKLLLMQTMDHEASMAAGEMRHKYKVRRVTNSVTPNLGDEMTTEQVAMYCNDERWEVTISND